MTVCTHCSAGTIDDIDEKCEVCGRPAGSRPYERLGSRFVLWRDAELPPMCFKCGAPASAKSPRINFTWHEPAYYFLILLGLLVYVIVALIVRKQMSFVVPMCDAHLLRRRRMRWIAGGVFVAGLIPLVAGMVASSSRNRTSGDDIVAIGCVSASLATLASLIVIAVGERTLSPKRIDAESGEFAGAGEAFLLTLE